MSSKQKKTLTRIIVSFVIFVPLFVLEHLGVFDKLPNEWILGGIYLVPYIIIGYDIIIKAARNISHGQVFDENFLMMIATFGAFVVLAVLFGRYQQNATKQNKRRYDKTI